MISPLDLHKLADFYCPDQALWINCSQRVLYYLAYLTKSMPDEGYSKLSKLDIYVFINNKG